MEGDPTPRALYQRVPGSVDGGYRQGDPSPEKLNGHLHLDTGSLPPLDCAGPLQGWVQALMRHCLLPTPHRASKKSCYVKSLSNRNLFGFLKLPVLQSLAVLIYTMKLAPSLHFCVQNIYLFILQFTLQQSLALLHWPRKSAESELATAKAPVAAT